MTPRRRRYDKISLSLEPGKDQLRRLAAGAGCSVSERILAAIDRHAEEAASIACRFIEELDTTNDADPGPPRSRPWAQQPSGGDR